MLLQVHLLLVDQLRVQMLLGMVLMGVLPVPGRQRLLVLRLLRRWDVG